MTLEAQVAALAAMSTAELAAEYQRVLGKAPRRRHPVYMRKRIAHGLQVAAYGGLSRVARATLDSLMAAIALPAAPIAAPATAPTTGSKPRPGTVRMYRSAPGRWPSFCSAARNRLSGSTCPSSWKSTRSPS